MKPCHDCGSDQVEPPLTRLDEFAKAAMQGIVSHGYANYPKERIVERAYELAELMLAESKRMKAK